MNRDSSVPFRILIVDDHPIVRLGLRQMIADEPELTICGEAASARAALDLVTSSRPDLAIVDLSLEDGAGLELIRSMRETVPAMRVLVLSMHDESLYAERALRAGARGYVTKQEAIDTLRSAVRQVLAGGIYVSERSSQYILEGIHGAGVESNQPPGGLTDRELRVFEMIGRGLATAIIAERLNVSVKTIETYRANIKTKLHLRDATELVRHASSWIERL